jgi:methionine synthase I (cobalamin-dependent)
VITTNTFSALMVGDPLSSEAVRVGVSLAREVAGDSCLVAGCVAAFGLSVADPQLELTVKLLVEEGVDLIVFETCNDPGDASAALQLKAALAPRLPMVISASSTDGSRDDKKRVGAVLAAVRMQDDPSVEVGLNCCRGPSDALVLCTTIKPPVRWLKPSTGVADDRVDDHVMAGFARAARQAGARFMGACCGSTHETLSAMAAAFDTPGSRTAPA